jgi:hypothetical protein
MIPMTPHETETGFELKKRVSWKGIFVREYNSTQGDHPMCSDNLPVSLDWSHSSDIQFKGIDESRERNSKYVFPRRLSYEARRRRVFGDGDGKRDEESNYWTQPAAFAGNKAQENSVMDLDELLQQEDIELDASKMVFYCRHAQNEDDDDDDSED